MTAPVVELRGVCRTFDRDPPVYALRDVDLSIWPGEWLAIVGPSGSGKSTLLNVLGLLDRPTEGTYRFDGVDANVLDDLARVGLSERAEFLPTRLSGGQRQRAAIARSLMGDPSLLLCDEPTGNLDSKSAANVLEILGGLCRGGLTLVVITHDEQVAAHADRRVRIIDGQLTEVEAAEMKTAGVAGSPADG